jgi:cell division protein FtsQ
VTHGVLSLPRRRPRALVRLLPSGRSLLLAGALVALAAGVYLLARETSMFAVRGVRVTGASPALARQVGAALDRFDGVSLVSLHGAAVVGAVEDLPAVVSATYDREFPHTLVVRVVPERPVAILRSGTTSWVVSARGRVVAEVARGAFRTLPRIWVPPTTRVEVGSFLSDDAGAAARALRAFVSAGFARQALWARIRDRELTVLLRSGVELRFGSATDLALKIAVVRGILPAMTAASAGGPTYLDVSVPDRPVAGSDSQLSG